MIKIAEEHINDLYDFNRNSIKLSGLDKSWHTSGSINTTLMGFNLFNGYVDEKNAKLQHLMNCFHVNTVLFMESIKLRYPEYYKSRKDKSFDNCL